MKNIVICCDGTGNEYGRNNTNVVETYTLVEKDTEQIAYYDPGVGTGGWEYHEETGDLRAMSDQVTGRGLQRNVEDAYRCLMHCYESGDRVYLFGFSRGAFTVRSLAGMLYKCGLLRAGHVNLVEYASRIVTTHPCYQRHARRERSEWPPAGCSPDTPWTADSLRFGNRLGRTCGCGSILRLSA